MTSFLLLLDISDVRIVGRPPRREDGSVIDSYNSLAHSGGGPSELMSTSSGGTGLRIYISCEEGGPILSPERYQTVYINPVCTSQEIHYVSVAETCRLMAFRGTIAVRC
jgi:hypothetical protein